MEFSIRSVREEDASSIIEVLNPIIAAGKYTIMDEEISVEEQIDYIRRFPDRGVFNAAPPTDQNRIPSLSSVSTAAVPTTLASLPEKVSETCPVTQPPDPPQPPGDDQFRFGESGLWTALPRTGSCCQLALGEKFWWWSEEFDVSADTTPDLLATAWRLNGSAPDFQVSEATNSYRQSLDWAMLVGVQLPEPGCWVFTGRYNDTQLSFVLWVPPE